MLTVESVNEVFDPDRVDNFYTSLPNARADSLKADRSTNYSVVRLELLEEIYRDLYEQKIMQPNESQWQHRILPSREVVKVLSGDAKHSGKLTLIIKDISPLSSSAAAKEEVIEVDAVLLATGYDRNAHENLLQGMEHLRPQGNSTQWQVRRDYKVAMDENIVGTDAGIWLQGCNESTHGLSDTLLSTLATRGGEMVESIFGRAPV